ncbi:MAG: recombinase family protein [Ktedonobacteraceae bacterium]
MRTIKQPSNNNFNHFEFPLEEDGIIYVRQSSLAQQQNNIHSFEMQTEQFVQYFRSKGCTGNITIIADDEAMSGTLDIHERPGMMRMITLIEEKKAGWIGAVHVNRLTRDPWLITPGRLMKICYEHNVWIATLRMDFNFKDDYCQRVFMLEAEESARHLEWMKLVLGGGKKAASSRGYYDSRPVAPGYIVDRSDLKRKKYMVYQPHADVTLWLARRLVELDFSLHYLCQEIDVMPYLFPKFEEWVDKKTVSRFEVKPISDGPYAGNYKPTRSGIESILTNPANIGWWIPIEGEIVKDNHPAIFPEDLFWLIFNKISTHDLQGNRVKPERVTRYGKVDGLLKKRIENEKGWPFYAIYSAGVACYKAMQYTGLGYEHGLVVPVVDIDPIFQERLFYHLRHWTGCDDWEEQLSVKEHAELNRKQQIQKLIDQACSDREGTLDILTDRTIPKTPQMKRDLAAKCKGLEGKIAKFERDLDITPDQELADEKIQHKIYTLLPALLEKWDRLHFEEQLLFVNALVRQVIVSHPAPSWLAMEIHWKRADWGVDVTYNIRRECSHTTNWSEKDDALLADLYPRTSTMDILQAFPDRTWGSIICHATRIGVKRRIKEPTGVGKVYKNRTLRDIEYEREHGIIAGGNATVWSARL